MYTRCSTELYYQKAVGSIAVKIMDECQKTAGLAPLSPDFWLSFSLVGKTKDDFES